MLFLFTMTFFGPSLGMMHFKVINKTERPVGIELVSNVNADAYIFPVYGNKTRAFITSDDTYQIFYLHEINHNQDPELDKIKWIENPRLSCLILLGSARIKIIKKDGALQVEKL